MNQRCVTNAPDARHHGLGLRGDENHILQLGLFHLSLERGFDGTVAYEHQSKTLVVTKQFRRCYRILQTVRHSVRADVANDKFIPQPKLVNQFLILGAFLVTQQIYAVDHDGNLTGIDTPPNQVLAERSREYDYRGGSPIKEQFERFERSVNSAFRHGADCGNRCGPQIRDLKDERPALEAADHPSG